MNNLKRKIQRPFRYQYNNFNLYIIIACVAIYFMDILTGGGTQTTIGHKYLGMVPALIIEDHYIWQVVTYMFVHGSFNHLFFNMFVLYMFGKQVEQRLGSTEYAVFYFFVGIMSGLVSFFAYSLVAPYTPLVGASGAIMGVMLAFATYYPDSKLLLFFVIPMKASTLLLFTFLIETFLSITPGAGGNTANLTHLFGMIFGYLYIWARKGINPGKIILNSVKNKY